MNPGKIVADRVNDHQRNLHPEGGPLIDAATGCVDRSAVHLDELPGNCQPQTEATALAGDAGIRLAESLEYMRKEFGRNTNAGIADCNFQIRVHAFKADLYFAAAVCELNGIRQKI